MIRNRTILHLSLIDGIGPAVIQLLLEKKTDYWQWHDLYQMKAGDFRTIFGISEEKAALLFEGLADSAILDKELEYLEKSGIAFLTILDEEYPDLLKHIHVPPAVLYVQGNGLGSRGLSVAVVGSRAMNWYGKKAIETIIPSLVDFGVTIVSGGAIGIDSYAHQKALEAGGNTIAVLGSGLLEPYPLSNKNLFKKIVDAGGSVISPFPLYMPARPGNFPARNRIIAGLGNGCLVVQAAAKSGAGITARFALEQGRDVFAVPGSIDDPLSAGCHRLIKNGAKLVHSAADILEEYGVWKSSPIKLKKNAGGVVSSRKVADPIHDQILSYCTDPVTIDELSQRTGMSLQVLNESLFQMQLQGVVSNYLGLWHRC